MPENEPLLTKHGGYRKLKSFQIAQLVYDVTVLFCDRYVDRRSRTRDQMVQAARSGVQNIAEGSQASGTSKKTEIKLTSVARASLEELRLDYGDFLQQRGLPQLPYDHPVLVRFKARRCATLNEVRQWVASEVALARRVAACKNTDEHRRTPTDTDERRRTRTNTDEPPRGHGVGLAGSERSTPDPVPSVPVRVRPCSSPSSAALAATMRRFPY